MTATSLTSVLSSIRGFIILDGIWLGLVTDFYRAQLSRRRCSRLVSR